MDINSILHDLRRQRDAITSALAALEGTSRKNSIRPSSSKTSRRRRKLSAVARKRISEAAKARWAKAKRAGRNRL